MRLVLIIALLLINSYVFGQKINNIRDKLVGSNIELSFDIQPKYQNKGSNEKYKADIYVRQLIEGYEEASIESFPRKKLNLPSSLVENLTPGRNVILIDVYDYLSEFLGSNTLVEYEVFISPLFMPAYFDNIGKLKIGKDNSINLNYWENAITSFSLAKDGNVVYNWSVNEDGIINIPKSLKKGKYKLNLVVEALGNRDMMTQDIKLIKGSPLPYLLILLIGGGVYFGTSSNKSKTNPLLPLPPLPSGG